MPYSPQLAVVIPVYNEEASLPSLLKDWQAVFDSTNAPYTVILIDDGSRDNSLKLLQSLQQADPRLDVHTQKNAGHGPAILKGYRQAVTTAEWIFQIDSDHQLDTASFKTLWDHREQYDLLLAQRTDKNASFGRQCVSAISKGIVRLFFGRGLQDVNSPYRLMRASELQTALEKIPGDSFAPNVLLSAWFIAKKKHIFTTRTELRTAGNQRRSKMNRYFLNGAIQSALQTIRFRRQL
ncbi:MAG TPA: glycosyltransferase family 2 protein [Puia sp.]